MSDKHLSFSKLLLLRALLIVLVAVLPISAGDKHDTSRLRVAVISDLNHSYGTVGYDRKVKAAIQRIIAMKPDLVICTGDMIAGQRPSPKLKRKKLEAMWRAFHETVTLPLKKADIPFVAAAGNHDGSASAGFSLERKIYKEQWKRAKPNITLLKGGNYPLYFAFKFKGVLFAVLDVTAAGKLSKEQRRWLAGVLDREGRKSKARIVFGHLPVWPLAVGRETGVIGDQKLEELFVEKSVSVYLSGHQHVFYPFYHGGQYYVSQAALGSGPRRLIGDKKRSLRSFTLVEVAGTGALRVRAYTGSDYSRVVKYASLPAKVTYKGTTLIRADLAREKDKRK